MSDYGVSLIIPRMPLGAYARQLAMATGRAEAEEADLLAELSAAARRGQLPGAFKVGRTWWIDLFAVVSSPNTEHAEEEEGPKRELDRGIRDSSVGSHPSRPEPRGKAKKGAGAKDAKGSGKRVGGEVFPRA